MSGRGPPKAAVKSKSPSVQKPKPAARPKQPAKKPAARAAPAPAAAAPPPAPEPKVVHHPVTSAERKAPRTLARWLAQKNNAAFFCTYRFTIKDEETNEDIPVWESAFSVKETSSKGGLQTLEGAFAFGREAYLSRVADDAELWRDPDAAALKERSREIISNPKERRGNGFTRNFRPGAKVQVRSGKLDVMSYNQEGGVLNYTRRSIDGDALSSLEAKLRVSDPQLFGCVEDFAADISSMPSDEQHKLLWDRAQTLHEITVADAQVRADDFKRRVADDFTVGRMEFEEDVGFDETVKADLSREGRPVTSLMDVDDFPRACLLGDADHCPIHDKIMEWFYLSERRNATRGESDRDKDRFRKFIKEKLNDGVLQMLRKRYPRLAGKYDRILKKMAERVHFDHIFSAICDHPMNLFVDFDVLNEHFGDFKDMPGKALYYGEVMRVAGEWLRRCFEEERAVLREAA